MAKKINISSPILFDEPMARHTSFRIGGPADIYTAPTSCEDMMRLFVVCHEEGVPLFALGEGANILVSDRGIRGVVADFKNLKGIEQKEETLVIAAAGTPLSEVSESTAQVALAGLENFYSMPGSVGGSLWMNARCYGISLSEILEFVDLAEHDGGRRRIAVDQCDFGYKKSPFQKMDALILTGGFRLRRDDPAKIKTRMAKFKNDRKIKGHFLYPSAGSTFKNNRSFREPTGKLIDALGLRGFSLGGAKISERHANIIINAGHATAWDVKRLIEYVKDRIRKEYGFLLEEEILYAGSWEE